jgi:hypothetical protein
VRAWWRIMRRISGGREVKLKVGGGGGGGAILSLLDGESLDAFVVLSISRWRLVDFWVE